MRGTTKPRVESLEPVPEWNERQGIKKQSERLNLDPQYGVLNSGSKFISAMKARLAHVKHHDEESREWMQEAIVDTLESGWDEIDGQIDDPFLSKAHNNEMMRRMPWVVIESVVDVYDRFQQDLQDFEKAHVFSGMANHVRAKARFLVALDDVLDLGEIRLKCIHDLKRGHNPTATFVRYYVQKPKASRVGQSLADRGVSESHMERLENAVTRLNPAHAAIDPYASRFDTDGPSWPGEQDGDRDDWSDGERDHVDTRKSARRGTQMLLNGLVNDAQLFNNMEGRGSGSPRQRVGSAPGLRDADTLWAMGVDTRQAKHPSASELLERHQPPGFQVHSDVLIARTDNRKGNPRAWDTDFIEQAGARTGDFNPSFNSRTHEDTQGIPPAPPLPTHTPKKKKDGVDASTLDDVQDYIDSGGIRKSNADLTLVSHKLMSRLEQVHIPPDEEQNQHPLLLASSYHEVDNNRANLQVGSQPAPVAPKRKLYLLTDRTDPSRAAVDAYFLQTVAARKGQQPPAAQNPSQEPLEGTLPVKPDTELKISNIRVSDRIPRSTLVLESVAPLYREFDTQVDPRALQQMDVRLYRHDEVKQMYQRMLEQLKIDHFELPKNTIDRVLQRTTTEKDALERAFFSDRAVPGCYSAPGGRPVINKELDGLPRMPVTKAEQDRYHIDLAGVSKPQRSYASRPPRVIANQSAGNDEAKPARAYNTWFNWWKSTYTTEDYMQYISEQKTDFLGTIFDLHGLEWEMVDSDEEADNVDPEVAKKQAALQERVIRQRREKTTYVRGQWNVNTINMGGLAWNPALHSAESVSDQGEGEEDEVDVAAREMQQRLNVVWGALQMPASQKLDMAIKYNSRNFMSHLEDLWLNSQRSRRRQQRKGLRSSSHGGGVVDVNALHDSLNSAIRQWEEVSASILQREDLMRQLEVFERSASDPARHFRKERTLAGAAVTRVSEANTRGKLHKQIAAVETELIAQLDNVYADFGDVVTYEGKPYRHKMVHDKQEMLYWLGQERRQKNISQTYNHALSPLAPPAQTATHVQTLGLEL